MGSGLVRYPGAWVYFCHFPILSVARRESEWDGGVRSRVDESQDNTLDSSETGLVTDRQDAPCRDLVRDPAVSMDSSDKIVDMKFSTRGPQAHAEVLLTRDASSPSHH